MDTTGLLTIREAAEASGLSIKTIRRRVTAGRYPGARQQDGAWLIPVAELLVDGTELNAQVVEARPPAEVERLQAEVVEWRTRALVAEAIAAERGAALDAERLALRALTSGAEATAGGSSEPPAPPRRRWLWR